MTPVPAAAPGSRVDGRTRLLDTAELLLDQRGIDGVSLRTVTALSGHRNASAVNYHFGNRDQLVRAVLTRRREPVEERRAAWLDELEAGGEVDPRAALEAAVVPLAELLDHPTGRRYLRLLNQAANHPMFAAETVAAYSSTVARAGVHVVPLVAHLPPVRRGLRLRHGLTLALAALADQARLLDTDPPPRPVLDRATFTADLLDAIVGALRA